VYGLQVSELIVIRVNTHAEEEAGIATVYDLVIPELDETRQLFMGKKATKSAEVCVPRQNWIDISDRAPQLPYALLHADGAVLQVGMYRTMENPRESTFSSSSYGTYHFDNRVLP
jgi:hypothetical protein